MISFTCKNCGQRLERPEEDAGRLVLCACGQANYVPAGDVPVLEVFSPETPQEVPVAEVVEGVPFVPPAPEGPLCLNHASSQAAVQCGECGEAFCQDCVVALQGRTLCGPCKNFRLRLMQRPPRLSMPALFSFLIALIGGMVGMFFLLLAIGAQMPALGVLGLLPLVAAAVLGFVALYGIEKNPKISGRAVAISGIVISTVGIVLSVTLFVMAYRNMENF